MSSKPYSSRGPARPLRVGLVADMLEERWPSMDLVADMLLEHLGASAAVDVQAIQLRPPMVRRLTRVPRLRDRAKSDTLDRVVNRFWDYPRWLAGRRHDFDVFHVVDHSYAHLVGVLPAARTVVTCHDTDAFLSLVEPARSDSALPKLLGRRICAGLQKARRVVCPSAATRDELHRYGILPFDRIEVVPNGVHSVYSPVADDAGDRAIDRMLGVRDGRTVDLLHVGSTIPRKRIDLLLRIVAALQEHEPRVRLIKAGGQLTGDQRDLLHTLGLETHVVCLPFLDRTQLAALYRRADVVLITSEREGFGLPVVEAMACGTQVVATDLPVLREVGGAAAVFCAMGDLSGWRDRILGLLQARHDPAAWELRRRTCIAHAARFSWAQYAGAMAEIYQDVLAADAMAQTPIPAVARWQAARS